ncbi:MAG: ATP-binding protein [Paracoccaceae bacterium]
MFKKTAGYALLGALLGVAAGFTAAYAHASWIVGAAVFLMVLIFGLFRQARAEAELPEQPIPVPLAHDALPFGFGRAMLRGLPSPLIVLSRKGRVIYANSAAEALSPNVQPGAHISNLIRAPEFIAALQRAQDTGLVQSVAFTTRLGAERLMEAQIGPLPKGNDFGVTAHTILQLEDRTAARRVETLRRDFIANASHELRTPLASIIGYIETLRGPARDDRAARDEFLGIMARQADRMQRLVDDLMSLSRIELNEHLRPNGLCDLTELAAECIRALAPSSLLEDVQVKLADGAAPCNIVGDRDQILQVLSNLIDNAIKYSGQGGLVTITTGLKSSRHPGLAGLSVTDTGPGIAREHLPRLTERFYRISAAKSRDKGGTGLGLAIVKHILNRHGGRLDIDSTLGEGSEFTVWIPSYPERDPDPIPE